MSSTRASNDVHEQQHQKRPRAPATDGATLSTSSSSNGKHEQHGATTADNLVAILAPQHARARASPARASTGSRHRPRKSDHGQQHQRRARAADSNNGTQSRSHSSTMSANDNSRQHLSAFGPGGNGNEGACARPWRCLCRACARPWRCLCRATSCRVGSAKVGDPVPREPRRHAEIERPKTKTNNNLVQESADEQTVA